MPPPPPPVPFCPPNPMSPPSPLLEEDDVAAPPPPVELEEGWLDGPSFDVAHAMGTKTAHPRIPAASDRAHRSVIVFRFMLIPSKDADFVGGAYVEALVSRAALQIGNACTHARARAVWRNDPIRADRPGPTIVHEGAVFGAVSIGITVLDDGQAQRIVAPRITLVMLRAGLSSSFGAAHAIGCRLAIGILAIGIRVQILVNIIAACGFRREHADAAGKTFVDAIIAGAAIGIHRATIEAHAVHAFQPNVGAHAVAGTIVRGEVTPFRAISIGKSLGGGQTNGVIGIGRTVEIGEAWLSDRGRAGHAFERALASCGDRKSVR